MWKPAPIIGRETSQPSNFNKIGANTLNNPTIMTSTNNTGNFLKEATQ